MSIYKLEDRVLFDAAAAVDAAEAQEAQAAQPEHVEAQDAAATEDSNINDAISELMQDDYIPADVGIESDLHDYIDAYVSQPEDVTSEPDAPKLILISDRLENAGKLYEAASEAGNLAVIYDADNTSADQLIQQIESILDGQKASSIAIAAEGDSNGNIDVLEADSDSAFWKSITDYVNADGRIDFMGSNLADSNYINVVAELTGLDVAASDDATGSAGDWYLEQGNVDLGEVYFDGLPPADINFTVNAAAEYHELVIINSSVADAEEIIDDLDNGVEVLRLGEDTNALEQINDYLDSHNENQYDTIRIISHGNEGYFVLNGEIIDTAYAAEHQAEFAALGEHLSADGDLMLYGCNLAANAEGQDLIDMISELIGADIAASTNDTSNAFDGDWHLEYTTGLVTTDAITVEGYDHHLASTIVTDNSQTALTYALVNIAYDGEIYYRLTPGTAYWNVVFVSNPIHIHGNVIISGNLDSGTVQFVNVGEDNHIFVVENTGSQGVYFMNCDIAGRSDVLNSFGVRVEADAKAYFSNVNMYGFKNVTLLNYGEVVLSNVNIHDNTGPQIVINHEYLVAGNTDFYNNTVSGSSSDPEGIVVHLGSTLSLANGAAYNNTSSSNAGFLTIDKHEDYSVSYAFVENFEIYQNSGTTGGAIYFYVGGAQLNLTNCNIHDNTASVYGGGIASIGGTIVIQDSQLSNNICSYNDTTEGIWGNSNFQFKGSFSSTNNSLEFTRDVTADSYGDKTFTNSTVYYTGTSGLGQKIAAMNYGALVLQGNNTKTFQSGTTSVEQQIEITDSITLSGSSSANVTVQVRNPYGDGSGSNISDFRVFNIGLSADETVTIENMTIRGGDISSYTALSDNRGGAIRSLGGTVNLNNCIIEQSKANTGGGVSAENGIININNTIIQNNYATSCGGGIFNASIQMTINGGAVNGNYGGGGVALFSQGRLAIDGTHFENNHDGPSIIYFLAETTCQNMVITNNNSNYYYLVCTGWGQNITFNNCDIYDNSTTSTYYGYTLTVGRNATVTLENGTQIYNNDGVEDTIKIDGNLVIKGDSINPVLVRQDFDIKSTGSFSIQDGALDFGETDSFIYSASDEQEIVDYDYHNLILRNGAKTAVNISADFLTIEKDITLSISGSMNVSSLAAGKSTVEYIGDATQTVAGLNYYNLTISGTAQRTLTGNIGIAGSFTADNTNFAHGNYTVTYNGGVQSVTALNYYDLAFAGTGTKTLAGNIGIAGSFTADNTNFVHNDFAVTYNGGDQAITALDYYQLALQGSDITKTFQDGVTSVEQQIEITSTITLAGSSADNVSLQVVDPGVTSSRLLYIFGSGKTININNMTLKGGDISSYGGVADGMGGTICLSYGDLNITNSVITGSTAFFGGGIDAGGNVVLDNTIIQNNTATQFGGGIYASFGTVTLQNGSKILNNSVNGNGGGICVRENAILNLNGSDILISGNRADRSEGGGIYSLGTTNIHGATIEDNSALAGAGIFSNNIINISSAIIQNNSADGIGGGGIYINSGTVTMSGNVIINNNTSDGQGDGVDLTRGTLNVESTASVTIGDKLRIAGDFNVAADASLTLMGGSRVVYYGVDQDILALDYYDLMFEHGAKTLAGDISVRGELTNYGAEFIHNSYEVNYSGANQNVAALDYYDLVFSGSGVKTLVGDIGIAGMFTADNTNFAHGNYTVAYNGGDQAVTALNYYRLALQGDNTTKTFQDGVTSVEQQIKVTDAVTLAGSSADNVTLQIVNPGITHSRLLEISVSGKTVDISNITLKGGNLSSYGGVLAGMGGAVHVVSGNLNLTDSVITDSKAFYGGGIYSTGNVVLDNTIIQNNTATQYGGGIYANSGTVTLQNGSQVLNNISTNGNGGGICVREHATLNLNGSNILISGNNCDTSQGGGIYSLGTTNVWGATIENNSALNGAGIFSNNILNIDTATIQNNSAGIIGGGGIYINSGIVTINGNVAINSNTADGHIDGIDLARGTLNIESAASVTIGDQLRISGDLNIASDASLTLQDGSKAIYYGGEQDIFELDYYDLVFEHGAKTLAGDISIRGELTNYGTEFIHNSYEVNYSGANQNVAALDYYNLKLSGSGTKTLAGDIGVAGRFTVDVTSFAHNNHAVDYNGADQYVTGLDYYDLTLSGTGSKTLASDIGISRAFAIDSVDFVHNQYNVDYNGTNQNIVSLDYYDLTLSGSGTKTLTGDIGIAGDFIVNSVDFVHNTFAVDYNGANQNIAGLDYYDLTLSGSGIKTLTGDIGIAGILTVDGIDFAHGNQTVTFNGDVQNINALDYYNLVFGGGGVKKLMGNIGIAGTFTATDANLVHNNFTVDYNGGDQTVAGLNYHGLSFSGSGTKTLAGDITLTGDWINDVMVDCSGYSVTFDGVTQHISGTGHSCFHDLVASTTGNTLILDQDITINGVLDLDQGVVDIGTYTLTLTEGITGDLSNLHVSEGTINYAGNVIQVIAGITYHNLILSNSVLVTATDINADNLTMSSGAVLKLTGSLNVGNFTAGNGTVNYAGGDQTISRLSYNSLILSGSGTKTFLDGNTSVANNIIVNDSINITGEATLPEDTIKKAVVQVLTPGENGTASRVFYIDAGSNDVSISNLTIKGGDISSLSGVDSYGGALYIKSGNVSMEQVTIESAKAVNGGGIYLEGGSLEMTNSTIFGNIATNAGGGIYIEGGALSLMHVTVAGNTAVSGGGIFNDHGGLEMTNSIVAYNTGTTAYDDIEGSIDSITDYNVIGGRDIGSHNVYFDYDSRKSLFDSYATVNSNLVPLLADNGGATMTVALSDNSVAIGAGRRGMDVPDYDQRGVEHYNPPAAGSYGGEVDPQKQKGAFNLYIQDFYRVPLQKFEAEQRFPEPHEEETYENRQTEAYDRAVEVQDYYYEDLSEIDSFYTSSEHIDATASHKAFKSDVELALEELLDAI